MGLFTGLSAQDLPLLLGYPASCTDFACGVKYSGPLESESLTAYIADSLLKLPHVSVLYGAFSNSC